MKCLMHKLITVLVGGLVPAILYAIIAVGIYGKDLSLAKFLFFYAAGVVLIFRFGVYGEMSCKINDRYKKS
jgi:hypothetical protein